MSLDGYSPPRSSSDRTFQQPLAHGLRETAVPLHRQLCACYEPLVGLSSSTQIGDGSGPLSGGTRPSWHEQMIVVGYGRISDREKRVTSAISTEHPARRAIRIIGPKRSRPTGKSAGLKHSGRLPFPNPAETDPRNSIAEMGISGSMPAMRIYCTARRSGVRAGEEAGSSGRGNSSAAEVGGGACGL
jgi:hypothetical protein